MVCLTVSFYFRKDFFISQYFFTIYLSFLTTRMKKETNLFYCDMAISFFYFIIITSLFGYCERGPQCGSSAYSTVQL